MMRRNRKLSAKEKAKRLEIELSGSQEAMSPLARAMWLERLAPEINATVSSPMLDAIYHLDYRSKPVPLREFLSGKEYLGSFLRGKIFPCIVDDLEELYERNCTEVLLTGGIGWGKTRMAELGIAYELYRVSCLRDPAEAYGLMPGSTLAFLNVSVKQSQAKRVFFEGLSDIIRRSEYFRKQFPFDSNIQSEIRFPRNVTCYAVASNESSLLGEGVFGAAFDEMNFMQVTENSRMSPEGGTYDQAQKLYNRLSRRIVSRMTQRGRLPGHLWMISSSRYPNDFTERKEAEVAKNPRIFFRRYPSWATRPRSVYLPGNFHVEIGTSVKRSRVLDGTETDVDPEKVVEVPMDFKEEFDKDTEAAVRDFAGVSTLTIKRFIPRVDLVEKMFEAGKQLGLRHPFTALEVTLQDPNDAIVADNFPWVMRGRQRVFPTKFCVHVDLAKNRDACGFAVCWTSNLVQVERGVNQEKRLEERPFIRVALLLRIVAPPQGEILAEKVRGLIYQLSDLGMEFEAISYDSWGSHESVQILEGEGYNVMTLSVDKTMEPYAKLKEAIYDGRIACYEFPALRAELGGLQHSIRTETVDHLPNGSKDVSDALAGAVYQCEQAAMTGSVELAAPTTNPPAERRERRSREEILERFERGEYISEEEFDRI